PKRSTTKGASVLLRCSEGMLHPGVADLLDPLVVGRAATHPIETLRYDRMVRIWQLIKMHGHSSVVARGPSHREANLPGRAALLLQIRHISHDDIRPRDASVRNAAGARRHGYRASCAVFNLRHFDRIHIRGDRYLPDI